MCRDGNPDTVRPDGRVRRAWDGRAHAKVLAAWSRVRRL